MKDVNKKMIAPSILAADFSILSEEVQSVLDAGVSYLHIDVMDGHFVNNISFGPVVLKHLSKKFSCFFDCHLMISNPDFYLEDFVKAGANGITVHIETLKDPVATFTKIKELGCQVGVSFKPSTDPEVIFPYLPYLDLVLVMTVEPGFGGQALLESQVSSLKKVI